MVTDGQSSLQRVSRVGVNHVFPRSQQSDHRRQRLDRHLLRDLRPEDGEELEGVGVQDVAACSARGIARRRPRELGRDLLREKVGNADQIVRLGGTLDHGLGLDHEGDDEVHGGVFCFPGVVRVRRVLAEQRCDVAADGLGHHLGEFGGEALDELARAPPSGVAVAALDVAADVLHVVGLEELLVVLSELQVRDDDGLANLSQGVAPREELVVDAVGHRGEEPDAGGDEVVLVGLQPRLRQQGPDVLDERLEEPLEFLLVLLDVQVNVVADGRLDLVHGARLLPVLVVHRRQLRVIVAQKLVKFPHPRVHVVLEHLG